MRSTFNEFDDMDLNFDFGDSSVTQESYDAASSGFSDFFNGKFNSFNPESIVSSGNNKLQSGMFDINIEDSDLALGYKPSGAATAPKPGRFV